VTCRSCGTTIAEKAIVCYKCGTPTADLAAVPRAPARARSTSLVLILVFIVEAAVAGAVYWFSQRAGWPWQVLAATGVILLVVGGLITLRVSAGARSGRLRSR
jgi:hypothetical protein